MNAASIRSNNGETPPNPTAGAISNRLTTGRFSIAGQRLESILWLDGLEEHNANTRDRFIYIHGTNHEDEIGQPASHGCIRMKNADLIALFDQVPLGAEVVIET